jgi:hypothetical protein
MNALRRLSRRLTRPGAPREAQGPPARIVEPVPPLGYDADAGLPFDPDALERRLVWIWGSPRSGSTWLLKQLCHPLVPDPESTTVFHPPRSRPSGDTVHDAVPIDESFISNHLAPAFADPREVDGAYVPGTINNYLGERPVYAYSRSYRAIWAPEARRFALVRLHGFLERARGDGVELAPDALVVIKEVNGSHAADLLMGLMPRARMLFLVRDGRDVVDSLLHAYQPGGFLARHQGREFAAPKERAEGLRWAAKLWACNVDMTLRAAAAHPPGLARTVRYEDLLADNDAEIAALQGWLGLERSADERGRMLADTAFSAVPAKRKGELERHRAARPGLWRENLSDEEQRTCMEIMGPRLEKLGYETD